MEKRYTISDAARQVMVETHVLRYWEEELGLNIQRNQHGHRYYREQDIRLMQGIKDLKEQGFLLRAIKLVLPDLERIRQMPPQELYHLREEMNRQVQNEEEYAGKVTTLPTSRNKQYAQQQNMDKMRRFEEMLRQMITSVMSEEFHESEERICEQVTTRLLKEGDYMFRQKEELQERQVELLREILLEVRGNRGQSDGQAEPETEAAASTEITELKSRSRKRRRQSKRKKIFAKSEQ